jgi:hypothetical protein
MNKLFVKQVIQKHPRPWRVSMDMTEIIDANGQPMIKVEYPRSLWFAQFVVEAVNAMVVE